MTDYTATVIWERNGAIFTDKRYSRAHRWQFDGGLEVPASSSPHVVPIPLSVAEAVDPEEAFVAALASCHMLWFLSIEAKRGFLVDRYLDHSIGKLAKNEDGRLAMTIVTLRPQIWFSGAEIPNRATITQMHAEAHAVCFIAASIRSEFKCEPVWTETQVIKYVGWVDKPSAALMIHPCWVYQPSLRTYPVKSQDIFSLTGIIALPQVLVPLSTKLTTPNKF